MTNQYDTNNKNFYDMIKNSPLESYIYGTGYTVYKMQLVNFNSNYKSNKQYKFEWNKTPQNSVQYSSHFGEIYTIYARYTKYRMPFSAAMWFNGYGQKDLMLFGRIKYHHLIKYVPNHISLKRYDSDILVKYTSDTNTTGIGLIARWSNYSSPWNNGGFRVFNSRDLSGQTYNDYSQR